VTRSSFPCEQTVISLFERCRCVIEKTQVTSCRTTRTSSGCMTRTIGTTSRRRVFRTRERLRTGSLATRTKFTALVFFGVLIGDCLHLLIGDCISLLWTSGIAAGVAHFRHSEQIFFGNFVFSKQCSSVIHTRLSQEIFTRFTLPRLICAFGFESTSSSETVLFPRPRVLPDGCSRAFFGDKPA